MDKDETVVEVERVSVGVLYWNRKRSTCPRAIHSDPTERQKKMCVTYELAAATGQEYKHDKCLLLGRGA
jgi:hypothetical protein